ncbi:MAG: SIR2 family protein [Acidobacteriota bacterium]
MIEPIISLAFSMHSNKGVYALLIGSGVSRSAGIPTGWEVVLDLIRKVAHLKGENCEPDPAAWYEATFGEAPNYNKLLNIVAKSQAERSQLLRSYFEPTEEEREQHLKIPTEAHKAIAELVVKGYIRVIVTTNFDRLIEEAIEEVGIVPTVISTPDAAIGALPITHTKCTIIKVHGDYLDTRIRNTPDELAKYDKGINRLLDQIFDDFGLIICGWSAEWDTALRAAIERCQTHRFTTYWAMRGKPTKQMQKLIKLRHVQTISIRDADSFFREIAEKVFALEELSRPHPLSSKVAVATLKKYIVDDHYKIRLHDLMMEETERVYAGLTIEHFPVQGVPFSTIELTKRIHRYYALTEILRDLMITGCYWGEKTHEDLWVKSLERIANPPGERAGLNIWLELRLFPALLLLYGGGIASIAAEKYGTFAVLLTKVKVKEGIEDQPLGLALYPYAVMDKSVAQQLPGMERRYTPISDLLEEKLREPFKESLSDDTQYKKCFDRFEYLLALVHADLRQKQIGDVWGPIGCFGWRGRRYPEKWIIKEIELEVTQAGKNWLPLKHGLFEGSLERFLNVKTEFDKLVSGLPWW